MKNSPSSSLSNQNRSQNVINVQPPTLVFMLIIDNPRPYSLHLLLLFYCFMYIQPKLTYASSKVRLIHIHLIIVIKKKKRK